MTGSIKSKIRNHPHRETNTTMKTIEEQLSTYKCVHLNPINVKTHFVGVPLIIWSLTLLLSLVSVPVPLFFSSAVPSIGPIQELSLAIIILCLISIYYLLLHRLIAIGLLFFILLMLVSAQWAAQLDNAQWIALAVFVIAWIIQFIGHYYEKARPAFFDDINQLLIGPLFLIAELYFLMGFEKNLNKEVTLLAIEKRKNIDAKIKIDKN